jgi:hypothetical protein
VPGLDLGVAWDWAAVRATAEGFASVTVSCEPTGHRWRVLGQLAADLSMPLVCVQPMQTSWARRSEDLTFDKTFDKTDDKDAVLIARLAAQLRCYVPEPVEETWGRLRHLGARRERLIVEAVARVQQMVQQMRDLLEPCYRRLRTSGTVSLLAAPVAGRRSCRVRVSAVRRSAWSG